MCSRSARMKPHGRREDKVRSILAYPPDVHSCGGLRILVDTLAGEVETTDIHVRSGQEVGWARTLATAPGGIQSPASRCQLEIVEAEPCPLCAHDLTSWPLPLSGSQSGDFLIPRNWSITRSKP